MLKLQKNKIKLLLFFKENKSNLRAIRKMNKNTDWLRKKQARYQHYLHRGVCYRLEKKTHTNGATVYKNANFCAIAGRLRSTLPQIPLAFSKLQNFEPYVIISITSAQVLAMIKRISPRKAAGIDNISAQLLRIACEHTLRQLFYPGETSEFAHRNFIF